ncbi:hypothetical protein BC940DRAFT_323419 [Gongronella butleri]|nr:hypothetical protein BC940DRAFT_323419 [Gongronella butleri]
MSVSNLAVMTTCLSARSAAIFCVKILPECGAIQCIEQVLRARGALKARGLAGSHAFFFFFSLVDSACLTPHWCKDCLPRTVALLRWCWWTTIKFRELALDLWGRLLASNKSAPRIHSIGKDQELQLLSGGNKLGAGQGSASDTYLAVVASKEAVEAPP